jgi:phenylacetate-CoA ligase
MARAIYAAGFRPGELMHSCFSYHFGPWLHDGEQRPRHGLHGVPRRHGPDRAGAGHAGLRPAGYIGTPSFLKIIVEKAAEMGIPLPSLTKAMLSAEPFRLRCATGCKSAASPATSATARPIWG